MIINKYCIIKQINKIDIHNERLFSSSFVKISNTFIVLSLNFFKYRFLVLFYNNCYRTVPPHNCRTVLTQNCQYFRTPYIFVPEQFCNQSAIIVIVHCYLFFRLHQLKNVFANGKLKVMTLSVLYLYLYLTSC